MSLHTQLEQCRTKEGIGRLVERVYELTSSLRLRTVIDCHDFATNFKLELLLYAGCAHRARASNRHYAHFHRRMRKE